MWATKTIFWGLWRRNRLFHMHNNHIIWGPQSSPCPPPLMLPPHCILRSFPYRGLATHPYFPTPSGLGRLRDRGAGAWCCKRGPIIGPLGLQQWALRVHAAYVPPKYK